jgi:putative aldouronate transport system substrate-binding protein
MRNKMWQSQDIVLDSDWAAWTGLYNNNARTAAAYPATVNVVGLPGVKGPDGTYHLEQGGLLLSAGIEGNDYNLVNGKPVFTDTGTKHGRDHGAPVPISRNFDMSLLGDMNPGFMESVAVGKRADVDVAPMGFANGTLDQRAFFDVLSKYMTKCILNGEEAAASMKAAADELRAKKIID